jgi:hypothetical protein
LSNHKTRYSRNPDFIFRKIVDEFILVPIHNDLADMECIYTLNPVGAFIWSELENTSTIADLYQALIDEYDADPGLILQDLNDFIHEMLLIGAVKGG